MVVTNEQPINEIISNNLQNVDNKIVDELNRQSHTEEDFWSKSKENRRTGAHGLFLYPGMMVPEVQRSLIRTVKEVQNNVSRMIDPYMGSATSLVAGMFNGVDCFGQDINPLSILVGKVKTASYSTENLNECTIKLITRINKDLTKSIDISFAGLKKWFRADVAEELSKIRRAILHEENIDVRRLYWLTLAETIRLTSNDRTSTYKLHARTPEQIESRRLSPLKVFNELINKNISDLRRLRIELEILGWYNQGKYNGQVGIELLDATKNIISPIDNNKFDLLITSPPYGDNTTTIPYGEHAYLPLQWIHLPDIHPQVTEDFIRTTKEIDNRSMGGRVSKQPKENIDFLRSKSPILASTLDVLEKGPAANFNKVIAFYKDLYKSVELVCPKLNHNAYMIWTLGNRRVSNTEIKNDLILADFLEIQNCQYVTELQRTILNKRMPNRNSSGSTMANERILILRKR